jgi:hypothetical protein
MTDDPTYVFMARRIKVVVITPLFITDVLYAGQDSSLCEQIKAVTIEERKYVDYELQIWADGQVVDRKVGVIVPIRKIGGGAT